jgi:hypothetical protein
MNWEGVGVESKCTPHVNIFFISFRILSRPSRFCFYCDMLFYWMETVLCSLLLTCGAFKKYWTLLHTHTHTHAHTHTTHTHTTHTHKHARTHHTYTQARTHTPHTHTHTHIHAHTHIHTHTHAHTPHIHTHTAHTRRMRRQDEAVILHVGRFCVSFRNLISGLVAE